MKEGLSRQWRGFILGVSALGSLLIGGVLAFLLGVVGLESDIPEKDVPDNLGTTTVFSAPETLSDGSIKSVVESWPDSSDRIVEYYKVIDGQKTLTRRMEYLNSGVAEKEITVLHEGAEEIRLIREKSSTGELQREYSEKNGKKEGLYSEFWENGFKKIQGNYKEDLQDGTWMYWNNIGMRNETSTFKKGVPHGPFNKWTPEGIRVIKGFYTDGAPSGTWTRWDDSGTPHKQVYSEDKTSEKNKGEKVD